MAQQKTSIQTTSKTTKTQSSKPTPAVAPIQSNLEVQQALQDPGSASASTILQLQSTSGNRSVQRLMRKAAIQAKLTVGPAGDRYEQEADRVADQVMRSSNPPDNSVQRHSLSPGKTDEEEVQRKPIVATISPLIQRHHEDEVQRSVIQRHAKPLTRPETEEDKQLAKEEEEGEGVQRKAEGTSADGFEAGAEVEHQLAGTRGSGQGLSAPIRADMESRFGANFGGVRIHTGAKATQLNRAVSAHAFTHGSDIYFNQGQYNPASNSGKRLLAHELTHVVQQTGPTTLATKRVQRLTPSQKTGPLTIQRAKKSTGKTAVDWLKRIFIGIPSGLVMAAAGAIVGPIMGGIQGYSGAKDSGKGVGGRVGGVLSGIVGGFVGGIGAGLMAGQKLAVHDPDDGDIAKGEAPPDLRQMDSEMLKKRLEAIKEKMQQDKNAQIELQLVATVLQLVDDDGYLKEALKNVLSDEGLLERINKKGGTVPNEGHFGDVKVAIKKHFANIDPSQYTDAMGKAIREVLKLPDAPPKNAILSAFFEGIRPHLKNTLDDSGITPASTGLFPEEQKYFNPGDNKTPDQAFWEERDQMEMEDAYVPDEQKPGFASALREMPTVKSILDPSLQEAQTRQGTAQWKDGGALHDEGNIDKVNDLSAPKKWMAPKRLNSRTFRNKVQRVDRLMRVVVEPQLLIRAKKPRIKLHATAAQSIDAPWGYRAHANDEEVNISYNEATETISHEVGHAVERHLPVSAWHDVHMLLSGRHQAAGGGGLKAGDTPIFTTWSEGRFGGKYVTGKYTSRTYSFGNIAEVVAMATQYFSDPGMAAQLIDGDPQHAAIVLRALQPAEYTSIGALRQYDKYLPHKKKPPLPPKLSPQKRKLLLERGRQRMEKHKEQQK